MAITPLPTPPSRGASSSNFSAETDAFLAALPNFQTEANALADDVTAKQATASTAATTATTKAGEAAASAATATTKAGEAAASAATAETAKNQAVSAKNAAETAASTAASDTVALLTAAVAADAAEAEAAKNTAVSAASTATTKASEAAASAEAAADAAASISGGPVTSVNGKTGVVTLTASDVGAQPALVSGTNIKTINASSLLGAGNIAIAGGYKTDLMTVKYATLTYPTSPGASVTPNRPIALDATRDLVVIGGATNDLYAVVYDRTAGTFGTVTLVRSAPSGGINARHRAILVGADKVLVVSCNSTTGLEAVVLSISGTTITVNAAASKTLGLTLNNIDDIIAVGSAYVLGYRASSRKALAMTVVDNTVTIGNEQSISTNSSALGLVTLYGIDTGNFLAIAPGATANTLAVVPVSVSGVVLTPGAAVTLTSTDSAYGYWSCVLSTGRWAILHTDTNKYVSVISVSGTTATASTVQVSSASANSGSALLPLTSGTCVVVNLGSSTAYCNVVTDTNGTASAGVELVISNVTAFLGYDSSSIWAVGASNLYRLGSAGANPSVLGATCSA